MLLYAAGDMKINMRNVFKVIIIAVAILGVLAVILRKKGQGFTMA